MFQGIDDAKFVEVDIMNESSISKALEGGWPVWLTSVESRIGLQVLF